jgi:hypothetical protein
VGTTVQVVLPLVPADLSSMAEGTAEPVARRQALDPRTR